MSTSASTTQLGRQFWSSIRVSVHSTKPNSHPLLTNIGLEQSLFRNTTQTGRSTRLFHSSRVFRQIHPSQSRIAQPIPKVQQICTSGGLLLLGLRYGPSLTRSTITACNPAADSPFSGGSFQKASISFLARQRLLEKGRNGRQSLGRVYGARAKSSNSKENENGEKEPLPERPNPETTKEQPTEKKPDPQAPEHHESLADSMSRYLHLQNLHLQNMIPHRPTKEELLAAATGFWQRMKVRFKWASIRSMRPWNVDEWGAFVSWFLFGHLVWVLVGTTTFFSLIILFINTVFAQETLAKWIGDYLTQSAGLTIIFESAIVPKWKDGVITFRNVFVSRRPGQLKSSVKKGSSNAAAEAAAARQAEHEAGADEEDDGNYTQFDVTIDTVNVTLSFLKWWNGKGLLKDVEVKGVRGIVDRTSVHWAATGEDPLSYRKQHNPGDFELDYFKLEDLLVTVHQPGGFRPYPVSIFSCELPQLRKQWLFYDFLSATHMSGSFDGSLFTIHPRQIHGVSSADNTRQDDISTPSAWKKFSRCRIDGLKIDHLNRGVEGPFGWIYEGNVDIVTDIMFPADPEEGIGKVVSDFYDKMEEAVTSNRYLRILEYNGGHDRDHMENDFNAAPSSEVNTSESPAHLNPEDEPPSYLVMDMRIHLNDVRAAVPLFNNHISYVNQALVRPIVAYINAKRTYIPINCRIVKRASDFDGSWTLWDCGLMDDTSAEVYSAFARNVEDQQSRVRRFKRVGLWTVSLVVHALLAGVAGDLV